MSGSTYELTIEYYPKDVIVGESVVIEGRLTKDGEPVKGATVVLYINGDEYGRCETDKNGEYRFVVRFDKSGVYTVQAVAYSGAGKFDWRYLAAAAIIAVGGVAIAGAGKK